MIIERYFVQFESYIYKKFQTAHLLEVNSKLEFFKNKHLQVVMFQNDLMDPKMSKEKNKSLYFFQRFWNLCVLSKEQNLCVFPISYKRKYVLLYLNMLRLFQDIKILFFFWIKLFSN